MAAEKVATGFVVYKLAQNEILYLLLKASYPPYHWTPPKGHVDSNEIELDTAYRETEEEAGFKREDLDVHLDFKQVIHYKVRGHMKKVVYWPAQLIKSKEVTLSEEHTEFTWAHCREAVKLIGYPTTGAIITACEDYIKRKFSKK